MKKILLIGDSIRKGYDRYVREAFENVAEVYSPDDNCRYTTYIMRCLHEWKSALGCGDDVDCVHWNAGLWDTLTMFNDGLLISLETYTYNIDWICRHIKRLFPKAKMIFATSTPVLEDSYPEPEKLRRYNKDIREFNEVAVKIVKEHGGAINDLYHLLENVPPQYHSDMTHYNTKEAAILITGQVVDAIEKCIAVKANEVDFDKYFADGEVIGL